MTGSDGQARRASGEIAAAGPAAESTALGPVLNRCAPCAEDASALASQYTALGVPVPPALARLADLTDCTKQGPT